MSKLNVIKLIFSFVLSTLILFSTTGIRISEHWCGDKLINSSIWGDAEPCDHFKNADAPACPLHANMPKKKCCSQKELIIAAGSDDFQVENTTIINVQFEFIQEISNWINGYSSRIPLAEHFRNHSPPNLGLPIFIRIQSFLI